MEYAIEASKKLKHAMKITKRLTLEERERLKDAEDDLGDKELKLKQLEKKEKDGQDSKD